MLIYIYDGSFDGLLTAIHEAYYRRERPERILAKEPAEQTLFTQTLEIATDPQKADKVAQAVREKISPEALYASFYAFLSELEEAGTFIYHYLDLGWKAGKKLNLYLHDDRVKRILDLSRKVSREKHRLLGLVRFRKLPRDIYYAPIEPDNNILALLAPHFAKRFADQNWIIHDLKRGIGAVYNQQKWFLSEITCIPQIELGENEGLYQKLWQQYFSSIAIAGRLNPKLQRRCMPVRYWKHLVEKGGKRGPGALY